MKCPSENALKPIDKDSSDSNKSTVCPKCAGLYLINKDSGEMINAKCKSYSCSHCGDAQQKRLYVFLKKYISTWDYVRMFTFTFRSSAVEKHSGHSLVLKCSEVWRRFIIYVRRCTDFSKSTKDFRYVRVTEFHKSGLIHYHVCIDRFLPIRQLNYYWNLAINQVFGTQNVNGNIDISKWVLNANRASKYIAKYVTKGAQTVTDKGKFRRWSKNKKGSIFPPKQKSNWSFYNTRSFDLEGLSITSQKKTEETELFGQIIEFDSYHPPGNITKIADDDPFWDYYL